MLLEDKFFFGLSLRLFVRLLSFCSLGTNSYIYYFLLCRRDYVEISNEKGLVLGRYCGEISGSKVAVSGDYVLITFHSDSNIQRRGYSFILKNVSFGRFVIETGYFGKVRILINQFCSLLSVRISRIESF